MHDLDIKGQSYQANVGLRLNLDGMDDKLRGIQEVGLDLHDPSILLLNPIQRKNGNLSLSSSPVCSTSASRTITTVFDNSPLLSLKCHKLVLDR